MLDIELDLVSKLLVVGVPRLDLEVDQETEVVVEAKKVILLVLVFLQDLLEVRGVGSLSDISRPAIETVTVEWGEWLDVDALLLTHDGLIVVDSSAVVTDELVLLNGDHDIVGQTDMDERVHASTVFLEHLSLLNIPWEISKDKSISTSVGKSQKLKGNSILDLLIDVTLIMHFFDFQEKWMIEVFRLSSELRDVLHNLSH